MSLTINSDLYGQALRLGINVPQVAEEALARVVTERVSAQIREEVRQDIEAMDAYIAEHGSFAEMLREHLESLGQDDS